ncbi:MAG: cytochrome c oxidase accessory protein CcoG [Alphaproteobacteria bacterium]|nr:cytochrome c oxidase accessory protein CcoG [Alphaproteobacteria bacterium]
MLEKYFVARKRLYPQNVKGKFRNLKWKLNFLFLSIYCFSPIIKFDRGFSAPNQAILIDIPNSKAYFFFIEIWAQEVFYLAGILILCAVTLFFITSLFGRVWCGYACFQTVWTDIFILLERFFQGDRNDRILLDRKNNFNKFYKKLLTHLSWLLVSFLTGLFFVSYFNDARELFYNLINLKFVNISSNVYGWILGIAGMTYIMAGFAREHVCTYMCPYARFQSAMFDDNTLIISYDKKRGEPRQKWHQGENFEGRGHCIDCKQCVVVCPVGIDIRNGLQMECIACGLCIDACDNVMKKVGLPIGLIRYDTMAHLSEPVSHKKFKFLQPRTFYYSFIIILVSSLMVSSLIFRPKVETSIYQERNPLYIIMSDGGVRNVYNLKIINKTHQHKSFHISMARPDFIELKVSNHDEKNIIVPAESIIELRTLITIPANAVRSFSEDQILIQINITDNETKKVEKISAIFIKNDNNNF